MPRSDSNGAKFSSLSTQKESQMFCLHPDVPLTFNHSMIPCEISGINFELLDPPVVAQVNALLVEIVPATIDLPYMI